MNCENESETGREEKQGAAEETNTSWTQTLSFGISCQDCGCSQPSSKAEIRVRGQMERDGERGAKHDPPPTPQPSHWELRGEHTGADSMRFIGGQGGVGGVRAWHSVVICMVLRCNCSISNNVVRLLVQTNRRRRSRSRGADRTSQLL